MTNQTALVPIAEINTLEAKGKALGEQFAIRQKKAGKIMFDFKRDTKADGFDVQLGELMIALRLEAEGGRISSDRLKECGIASIPKQRRSEAEWYVNNKAEADAFNKKAKKGFKSLPALQRAMAKAKQSDEPKGSAKSNVGPTTSGERSSAEKTSAIDIVLMVMQQCEQHNVVLQDVVNELNLLTEDNKKAVA